MSYSIGYFLKYYKDYFAYAKELSIHIDKKNDNLLNAEIVYDDNITKSYIFPNLDYGSCDFSISKLRMLDKVENIEEMVNVYKLKENMSFTRISGNAMIIENITSILDENLESKISSDIFKVIELLFYHFAESFSLVYFDIEESTITVRCIKVPSNETTIYKFPFLTAHIDNSVYRNAVMTITMLEHDKNI